ncbi:MAG: hypothetical protein AB1420_00085 [Bacillota bacterium]
MNVRQTKELEIKIIKMTDDLIETIVSASLTDNEEREMYLDKALNLVTELSKVIHQLINNDVHLESMLNQLVLQKLPDESFLETLEYFSKDIEKVIQLGVENFRSNLNNQHSVENDCEILSEEPLEHIQSIKPVLAPQQGTQDSSNNTKSIINENLHENSLIKEDEIPSIYSFLINYFQGEFILKDYVYKGARFQYYVPSQKLVLEETANGSNNSKIKGIKEYIINSEGLKLIKLPYNTNYYKLKKLLDAIIQQ